MTRYYRSDRTTHVTKEACIEGVRAYHAETGRSGVTGYQSWFAGTGHPAPDTVIRRCGNWTTALEAAGIQPNKPTREYTSRWTDDDLKSWVRRADTAGCPGVSTATRWLRSQSGAPSQQLIRKRFGPWADARVAAGLRPNEVPPRKVRERVYRPELRASEREQLRQAWANDRWLAVAMLTHHRARGVTLRELGGRSA